ncbi:MAG: tRNA (adenosine(37)-N6)-threonylcarbamoyltransferase complex dimerization subunit type 1 TsaB [Acidobacteriaceae bacterium]|nr:tRNA (adenosine(37)-N6)-threonylcarbamoyltransferase complex dimerization subunit type 1 TsaB [Acidobacteriaceae bacterium]
MQRKENPVTTQWLAPVSYASAMVLLPGQSLLLLDTCGQASSVALVADGAVVAEAVLPERTASSQLVRVLAEMLAARPVPTAVGVVSGPGSFTGVRVGLAAAKALAEAWEAPLVDVSRLEVLGEGLSAGLAAMDAGRGELYLRDLASGKESLESLAEVDALAATGLPVVTDSEKLAEHLPSALVRTVHAKDALAAVLRALQNGTADAALLDANYVRSEKQIYGKSAGQ